MLHQLGRQLAPAPVAQHDPVVLAQRQWTRPPLGSDTGQPRFFIGWMGQLEFENWVRMGLTPSEAIVAATRDSAAAARINIGLIAAGRNADFIVLDANPLQDIANSRKIHKVYLRGQEVDRAGLRAKWQARWKKL